eukprot:TRINITY_DN75405_c0_g1_i1.p1 TRINITY_DN75405_c0_g1~~TRINITY_DN75405_c0_g1_i1.p1  ORF type:complete len:256 (+),score=27.67 TRINITY_DN75405_c0_g1_i1:58-825(+)
MATNGIDATLSFAGPGPNSIKTHILNARQTDGISLQKTGFEIFPHRTSLKTAEFYSDEDRIKSVYYDEIARAIKEVTGAEDVKCSMHRLRNGEKYDPETCGHNGSRDVHNTKTAVHMDFSHAKGQEIVKSLVGAKTARRPGWHFQILNVWRNISDANPIQNDHLALLDPSSQAPDDTEGLIGPPRLTRVGSHQKWFYYPGLTKEEILVFKQYDSCMPAGAGCFHGSFEDPTAPSDAPPRESIELRAVVIFAPTNT